MCSECVQFHCIGVNFDSKVKVFKEQFESLHRRMLSKIQSEGISINTLLTEAFSVLPVGAKNESDTSVRDILQNLITEGGLQITSCIQFLNYSLIRHLILKFGDAELQQDMKVYLAEIEVFMKETTIGMIADCCPQDMESHVNCMKLMVNFNENPKTYTLERLSNFKAKFCMKVHQSELVFCLVTLEAGSSSFLATWMVPAAIKTMLTETALNHIGQEFYQEDSIALVLLEDQDSHKVLYTSVRCML